MLGLLPEVELILQKQLIFSLNFCLQIKNLECLNSPECARQNKTNMESIDKEIHRLQSVSSNIHNKYQTAKKFEDTCVSVVVQ